jgi:hypothetical protein
VRRALYNTSSLAFALTPTVPTVEEHDDESETPAGGGLQVGQIVAGIALGPHGLEIAPKHDALMLMGELGLVLMVLEAGIEVELSELAVVGARGVMVAVVGSLLPLSMGAALSMGVFNMTWKSALAVGASLAPTSMGISLKVLEEGKVLSTPTGQLIIAAAVIDDVIALVLLAQLEALANPTPINFIIPIISSLGYIFVLGYAAVKIVPGVLAHHVVPRLPVRHLESSLLGMVLACGSVLMATLHYSQSSHLLGAFLGGLMFCTLSSVKSVWHHKVLASASLAVHGLVERPRLSQACPVRTALRLIHRLTCRVQLSTAHLSLSAPAGEEPAAVAGARVLRVLRGVRGAHPRPVDGPHPRARRRLPAVCAGQAGHRRVRPAILAS